MNSERLVMYNRRVREPLLSRHRTVDRNYSEPKQESILAARD